MNPLRALLTVAISTALFGGLGAAIGWQLGTRMPNYYRGVFVGGSDPRFEPQAVGLGQGLTQGLILGAAVGLTIVGLLIWREVALEKVRGGAAGPERVGQPAD